MTKSTTPHDIRLKDKPESATKAKTEKKRSKEQSVSMEWGP
uniref:Uncharacterized protein n=1 Tax=Utricularia reniformis TaxID=192314 RepID=A0A1Y0B295_9LAMI|nr:hypothetical protein AEK19_MT1364 [Utricularia reniformis]ART31562.1 hypothetical protein AEK19_MT1364 [Utricularia reniformis]